MPHDAADARSRRDTRDARDTARALALDGTFAGRAVLTFALGWWTAVLLLPGRTFGAGSGAWFATLAPESAWAAFCGAAAVVCGSALFIRRATWRLVSALCTACAFGVLAYGYLMGNPRSGNAGTHLALAAWANWLAFRNAAGPAETPCRGCLCRRRWCGAPREGGPG